MFIDEKWGPDSQYGLKRSLLRFTVISPKSACVRAIDSANGSLKCNNKPRNRIK